MTELQLLAIVDREGFDESFHYGSAVLLEPGGSVIARVGDIDAPMLPRSTLKSLFAATVVDAGLDLLPHELALASGSVHAHPVHLEVARVMAERLGVTEDDLQCPPTRPHDKGDRTRFAHMCVGKHIALAAAGRMLGDGLYTDPTHPLQVRLQDAVASLTGVPVDHSLVDGCGALVFSSTLLGLARSMQSLAVPSDNPLSQHVLSVGAAMRAHPELVEGEGTPDTTLMREAGATSKSGAEGTQVIVAADGTTAVVTTVDGARRGALAAALSLLEGCGAIERGTAERHAEALGLQVTGGGRVVGRVRSAV